MMMFWKFAGGGAASSRFSNVPVYKAQQAVAADVHIDVNKDARSRPSLGGQHGPTTVICTK